MSVREKIGSKLRCTDAARIDGASKRVTAGIGRGDFHPDIVAVDEGNVVGHLTRDGILGEKDVWRWK